MAEPATPFYEKKSNVECNELPDGYVIYDREHDKVHFLNFTAAALYELCDGSTAVAAMADVLREAFDLSVSPAVEVDACLSDLCSQGLIVQAGQARAD